MSTPTPAPTLQEQIDLAVERLTVALESHPDGENIYEMTNGWPPTWGDVRTVVALALLKAIQPTGEVREARERLLMLADACGVSGFDHLPVVSRENATDFARDIRLVLGRPTPQPQQDAGSLGWPTPQPIADAPKDGRWLIGWTENFTPVPIKWHPTANRGIAPGWWGSHGPTHFIPFPPESLFDAAAPQPEPSELEGGE